ncbi:MarR family transcriptional regulator [Methanohalophilus sp. RSK]|uniref:MarR family transcriptional regulator n=1 Tax=Methanohalophilus sp. RSK TaxID=2485783 RepID=UPI000F43ACAF|nr:MarR family transcriptional regulator [Methanohalophilus sp. RSK]RNI12470.1 MarR family transcriptional regulator [Methanohalophilus sp. RSK]
MSREEVENLFLQEKPTLALLTIWSLRKTYASVITKQINSTFAHTTKILSKMSDMGLVQFTAEGRIKYVELTEYGVDVVTTLRAFITTLGENLPEKYRELVETVEEEESEGTQLNRESEEILERIKTLRNKIEEIYGQLVEANASEDRIKLKLGPFSREIHMIGDTIENSEEPIHDDVLIAYGNTKDVFDKLLGRK